MQILREKHVNLALSTVNTIIKECERNGNNEAYDNKEA
jgi:hypothetical protein